MPSRSDGEEDFGEDGLGQFWRNDFIPWDWKGCIALVLILLAVLLAPFVVSFLLKTF